MKPVWSLEQVVAQLTNWQARWDLSAPVAYSFYEKPAAHLGQPPGFSSFSFAQREALARAAQLISDVCGLSFVNLPDNGQEPSAANSRIGFFNINSSNAPFWGAAQNFTSDSEEPPMGRLYGADVVVNQHRAAVQGGWGVGQSNPRKLMHELLHTLGVDHPGAYNGDGNTYEANAEFQQDTTQYTVMSYWAASITGADHELGGILYHASTPLLYDVAALQHLYGANMSTRTGDTVYGFNSNAGRSVFDLAAHPQAVFTIWDSGGNDTLDLSGYSTGSRVDLNQGAFTDAGGLTGHISIAFGAIIENAVGGSGADSIIGNSVANRLTGGHGADKIQGGRGADVIEGGAGGDTFVFASLSDSRIMAPRSDGKKIAPDVLDFASGEDWIDLNGIDAIAGTAANDAFTFIGSGAFTGQAGQLRFEVIGGRGHLLGDVDGNGIADLHIVTAGTSIQPADLFL